MQLCPRVYKNPAKFPKGEKRGRLTAVFFAEYFPKNQLFTRESTLNLSTTSPIPLASFEGEAIFNPENADKLEKAFREEIDRITHERAKFDANGGKRERIF